MKLELQCTFNHNYVPNIYYLFCNFLHSDQFNSKYHSVKGNQYLMFWHRGNFSYASYAVNMISNQITIEHWKPCPFHHTNIWTVFFQCLSCLKPRETPYVLSESISGTSLDFQADATDFGSTSETRPVGEEQEEF